MKKYVKKISPHHYPWFWWYLDPHWPTHFEDNQLFWNSFLQLQIIFVKVVQKKTKLGRVMNQIRTIFHTIIYPHHIYNYIYSQFYYFYSHHKRPSLFSILSSTLVYYACMLFYCYCCFIIVILFLFMVVLVSY